MRSPQPHLLHQRSQLRRPPRANSSPVTASPRRQSLAANHDVTDEEFEDSEDVEENNEHDFEDPSTVTPQIVRGVPRHIFKELLTDIEEAGGLNSNLSLKHICDQKPRHYGTPNSKLRKQISNKVYRLKLLSSSDYQVYLNFFKVHSARLCHIPSPTRTANDAHNKNYNRARQQSDFQDNRSPPSRLIPSSPLLQRPASRIMSSQRRSSPGIMPETPPSYRSALPSSESASRRLEMNSQTHAEFQNSENVDVIEVNLAEPEQNREVVIYSVSDIEHGDNVYNCFCIFLSVDFRDTWKEGAFTAKLISDNEVLMSMPSLSFGLFHDSRNRNERLRRINLYDPKLQLSQDIVINQIKEEPTRQQKRLLLRFPDGVILANIFNPGTPSLFSEMHTDKATVTMAGIERPCTNCFMVWKVANLETHRRARIADAAASAIDVLASQFASLQQHVWARNNIDLMHARHQNVWTSSPALRNPIDLTMPDVSTNVQPHVRVDSTSGEHHHHHHPRTQNTPVNPPVSTESTCASEPVRQSPAQICKPAIPNMVHMQRQTVSSGPNFPQSASVKKTAPGGKEPRQRKSTLAKNTQYNKDHCHPGKKNASKSVWQSPASSPGTSTSSAIPEAAFSNAHAVHPQQSVHSGVPNDLYSPASSADTSTSSPIPGAAFPTMVHIQRQTVSSGPNFLQSSNLRRAAAPGQSEEPNRSYAISAPVSDWQSPASSAGTGTSSPIPEAAFSNAHAVHPQQTVHSGVPNDLYSPASSADTSTSSPIPGAAFPNMVHIQRQTVSSGPNFLQSSNVRRAAAPGQPEEPNRSYAISAPVSDWQSPASSAGTGISSPIPEAAFSNAHAVHPQQTVHSGVPNDLYSPASSADTSTSSPIPRAAFPNTVHIQRQTVSSDSNFTQHPSVKKTAPGGKEPRQRKSTLAKNIQYNKDHCHPGKQNASKSVWQSPASSPGTSTSSAIPEAAFSNAHAVRPQRTVHSGVPNDLYSPASTDEAKQSNAVRASESVWQSPSLSAGTNTSSPIPEAAFTNAVPAWRTVSSGGTNFPHSPAASVDTSASSLILEAELMVNTDCVQLGKRRANSQFTSDPIYWQLRKVQVADEDGDEEEDDDDDDDDENNQNTIDV